MKYLAPLIALAALLFCVAVLTKHQWQPRVQTYLHPPTTTPTSTATPSVTVTPSDTTAPTPTWTPLPVLGCGTGCGS